MITFSTGIASDGDFDGDSRYDQFRFERDLADELVEATRKRRIKWADIMACPICNSAFIPAGQHTCSYACGYERHSRNRQTASFTRFLTRFTVAANGCWEWGGHCGTTGYGSFQMRIDGRGIVPLLAHRASYMFHVGPIPDGLWVLHKCDNRRCVNPDHLFLGTQQDNVDDMIRKGRHFTGARVKGEQCALSKLTAIDVTAIRQAKGTVDK